MEVVNNISNIGNVSSIPAIPSVDKTAEYKSGKQNAQPKVSTSAQVAKGRDLFNSLRSKGLSDALPEDIANTILTEINKKINRNTNAQFSFHEKTNRVMIKIMDSETNEVIREIPPEKTLDMVAKVLELVGLLVDDKR